ncbi:MAG TPA: cbb3-type cytochrome c oxidase subunit 3 [Bdellovibrionales bacterium]|nr:cbb3-type cytochrome c oxidase subunit 3 [Bdellovibrionales bacterium]
MSGFLRQLYTSTDLTAAGLMIFFGFFVIMLAWIYLRTGAKRHYEDMGRMPLNEGEICE